MAGLYRIADGAGQPVKMISSDLAKADAAPIKAPLSPPRPYLAADIRPAGAPEPMAGCYFRALVNDENGFSYRAFEDYNGNDFYNTRSYAFCAFAPDPAHGTHTFIINHEGVIYAKDTGGKAVEDRPDTYPPQKGWEVVQ